MSYLRHRDDRLQQIQKEIELFINLFKDQPELITFQVERVEANFWNTTLWNVSFDMSRKICFIRL
jgi:hypothetical protein